MEFMTIIGSSIQYYIQYTHVVFVADFVELFRGYTKKWGEHIECIIGPGRWSLGYCNSSLGPVDGLWATVTVHWAR